MVKYGRANYTRCRTRVSGPEKPTIEEFPGGETSGVARAAASPLSSSSRVLRSSRAATNDLDD